MITMQSRVTLNLIEIIERRGEVASPAMIAMLRNESPVWH
jgi:hypothetical protein